MSVLNAREKELVSIGAAMASNCVPCMEYHIPEAQKAGLTDAQIIEAIRVADRVRQVPARKVLEVAMMRLGAAPAADPTRPRHPCEGPPPVASGAPGGDCGCK